MPDATVLQGRSLESSVIVPASVLPHIGQVSASSNFTGGLLIFKHFLEQ